MRFRLGGDGTDGTIDCINMVYVVLRDLAIATPDFDQNWYQQTKREHLRQLRAWGVKVHRPYNGDVLFCAGNGPTFGVIWEGGVMHISKERKTVHWLPVGVRPRSSIYRCSLMSGN